MRASPDIVAVAYSGGRDSTALLHATLHSAAELGLLVVALHIHHGLSAQADAWSRHCEKQCARWAAQGWPVSLQVRRLNERPDRGASIEAWARKQRYRALREMALEAGASVVLLAHHQRDQAETFLLQALRGGGLAGLAGMPQRTQREGLTWIRPWLRRPRASIEAYVKRHRLKFVDDDSNSNPRFDRNRMRLRLWPALEAAFPDAEDRLSESARWAQEALALLDEVAALDLKKIVSRDGALDVPALRELSDARAANALRAWFKTQAGVGMPASLAERLRHELGSSSAARWPAPGGELVRYRRSLSYRAQAPAGDAQAHTAREPGTLTVTRCGRIPLPAWGGALRVRRCKPEEPGVALSLLSDLSLRARVGQEQFQLGPARPARSLKKQFQALGIAPQQRQGPLLWARDRLVFVPGLGLDARVLSGAANGGKGGLVTLEWEPLAPARGRANHPLK